MSNSPNKIEFVLSALLLAIGISVAGFFISETIYKSKVALNTAQ